MDLLPKAEYRWLQIPFYSHWKMQSNFFPLKTVLALVICLRSRIQKEQLGRRAPTVRSEEVL